VPQATITATVIMASGSVLLLVPYFAYVFDFPRPEKVIARIGAETARARDVAQGREGRRPTTGRDRQAQALGGPRQPGRHRGQRARAEGQGDRDRRVGGAAPPAGRVPGAQGRLDGDWFTIGAALRADPDFVALASDSLDDLGEPRTWLEWKGLRQLREVFGAALTTMPEMAHVVAIDTRYVGEAALAASDREVLVLTVKFMNTYLRAALNARDVRTAYNVLNQYRQLAESLLATRNAWPQAVLVDIAGHFKYYARLAHGIGLAFVTETAAYDMCALCEMASAYEASATIGCWRCSWRSTASRRRRPRSARCAACARRRRSWRRTTSCTIRRRAPPHLRRHGQRIARAAAVDPRRDARDHLQGLLGGRRPRHQLRLPVRRAQGEAARVLRRFPSLAGAPAAE
jgi:hypothetical protein